ncbi:MAG: purine-binding chemotaxis protein CheW [candidate division Zixibacteria bacterium]|nr:purine-binding chemotaxis protein CheW [candidate division Zixibacteria bacterium]
MTVATTDTIGNPTRTQGPASMAKAGKYLTFRLASEVYGLEILKVREIIGLINITRIPQSPAYIRGVINLRGKVIPVLDLRRRFGMAVEADTEQTCIIVVDVKTASGKLLMGVVVDAVSEVLDIGGQQIESAPAVGSTTDGTFIHGIAKLKDDVKILLDIDRVFDGTELDSVVSESVGTRGTELVEA